MVSRPRRPTLDSARFGRTPVQFLLVLAACCLVAIVALAIVLAQRGPAPALVGLVLAGMFGAGAGIAVLTLLLGRAFGTGVITPPELGPHAGQLTGVSVGAAI